MRKNKGSIVISTFKIDIMKVPLFFQVFYSLVFKIEICLKCFLDKYFQKQPLCSAAAIAFAVAPLPRAQLSAPRKAVDGAVRQLW